MASARSAATREGLAAIQRIDVGAFTLPTDAPESDGTLAWESTTIVVVHATAGDATGVGYTYAHAAAARLIEGLLAGVVVGHDAADIEACYVAMIHAVRNHFAQNSHRSFNVLGWSPHQLASVSPG